MLPDAHTDAPAAGSAILAGVLLKLGTYGFVRIALPMLPSAWQQWAMVAVVVRVISVLWGALVALAQTDFKRMIAYTSINHMGYVLLGLGAAGLVGTADADVRVVATVGATVQMVSHGLLTAALFLLSGVLWARGGTYGFARWGGLARPAPLFAAALGVAAFGSLGLPGFSSFIAEFQIIAGALQAAPVAAILAAPGILITAALFLVAIQRLLTGPTVLTAAAGYGPEAGEEFVATGSPPDSTPPAQPAPPVAALLAAPGILLTAALFLVAIQRLLTGPTVLTAAAGYGPEAGEEFAAPGSPPDSTPATQAHAATHAERVRDPGAGAGTGVQEPTSPTNGGSGQLTGTRAGGGHFQDLSAREIVAIVPLLALSVLIGLFPRPLLDVIEPAASAIVQLVSR